MPNRVSIHWDGNKDEWKAYVFDGDSHDGYGKNLVHVYDEPPCIARLAFVAHFDEVMALLYSGVCGASDDPTGNEQYKHRCALHNLVMKSIREQAVKLQADLDKGYDRKTKEASRLVEENEKALDSMSE